MVSAADRKKKAARKASTRVHASENNSDRVPTSIAITSSSNISSKSKSGPVGASAWNSINPSLSPWILDAVTSMGFTKMTPVQASTIPLFLGNKDVVVEAVTGSGKTLAFLIPVVERLLWGGSWSGMDDEEEGIVGGGKRRKLERTRKRGQVGAIIISPTRELATQIYNVLLSLLAFHPSSAAALPRGRVDVGAEDVSPEAQDSEERQAEDEEEEDMNDITESAEPLPESSTSGPRVIPQLLLGGIQTPAMDLKKFLLHDPNILIGTPGRLNELLSSPYVHCTTESFEMLVLDEADRLLDLGFKDALTSIISKLPKQRRTGLFSATISDAVVGSLVRTGLRNPVKVVVKVRGDEGDGDERRTPASLENTYIVSPPHRRLYYLRKLFSPETKVFPTQPSKVIIYLSSCASVDYFSALFPSYFPKTYSLIPLHGKQSPNTRSKNFEKFTNNHSQKSILLTTDLAARGLDIPAVDLVVQLDGPPTDPKAFLHRCGRAGRAGRRGMAVLFLSPGREEEYVDFLAVRKTPVTRFPELSSSEQEIESETTTIISGMRACVKKDRAIWEKGLKAFVSNVRAYSKHMTQSIFRISDIDWHSLVEAHALLTVPAMPELRGKKMETNSNTNNNGFNLPSLDISNFAYKDPVREKARLAALAAGGTPHGITLAEIAKRKANREKKEEAQKRNASWSNQKDGKQGKEERREKRKRKREATRPEEEKAKEREWKELVEEAKKRRKESIQNGAEQNGMVLEGLN